ncbi:MAG: 16S rRNA (adenine(1518)-N(6)/adenine(1519)-N(6))-dimethyltransferase RsmA [Dehalococcoidales bacterium]|nr:16S rRNA (adenine(1518)-N(6)/adenine(1519)-N(6))-dimethyltransferase RsmA [Dehalococcoidales bacterium]
MQTESLLTRTKKLLASYDLHARKGLGQHFLVDGGILKKITAAAELSHADTVVEVGPGLGVLTQELAEQAGKVIAIELDEKLSGILEENFKNSGKVTVINEDVLKVKPSELPMKKTGYKVVANLPYYITSAVIRHFLESENKPALMVLMVQKEVAKQITARPGEMSLLSVSVQIYGKPKMVDKIPARSFYPPPKVDSAILRIETYPEPKITKKDAAGFFDIVRAGFSANRKQLANSLANGLKIQKSDIIPLLQEIKIDPARRAETLTIDEWLLLCKAFNRKMSC